MSDLKLFRITNGSAQELKRTSMLLEISLQRLIEGNMEALFGVRFLATEYSTGAKHIGRIDSLGLDETGSPVIFEYKRAVNESVINQVVCPRHDEGHAPEAVHAEGRNQVSMGEQVAPRTAAAPSASKERRMKGPVLV